MPVVRVPTSFGELEYAVSLIEDDGEIVAAIPAGDGAAILFVKPKGRAKSPAKETR